MSSQRPCGGHIAACRGETEVCERSSGRHFPLPSTDRQKWSSKGLLWEQLGYQYAVVVSLSKIKLPGAVLRYWTVIKLLICLCKNFNSVVIIHYASQIGQSQPANVHHHPFFFHLKCLILRRTKLSKHVVCSKKRLCLLGFLDELKVYIIVIFWVCTLTLLTGSQMITNVSSPINAGCTYLPCCCLLC